MDSRTLPNMRASKIRSAKGFTLIEMMVVVAILAVMAALTVPSMTPLVSATKLEGNTSAVASLLARAQAEAMAAKRCARVRLADAQTVVAELLNAYDCDVNPSTAPLIDSGASLWVEIGRVALETSMTATFSPVPSETTGAFQTGEVDQIRFRPSGRLFSSDAVVTDDDGVIMVTFSGMPSGMANTKKVLVEAQGLICMLARGTNPNGSGNDLACP